MFDKKQFNIFIKRINSQKKHYSSYLRTICPIREWFVGLLLSFLILLVGSVYIYNINTTYLYFDFTDEINDNVKISNIFKKRSLYNALSVFDKKEAHLQEIINTFGISNESEGSIKEKQSERITVDTTHHNVDKSSENIYNNNEDKNKAISEFETPSSPSNKHNDLMPLN